jgi:hypothetical protein
MCSFHVMGVTAGERILEQKRKTSFGVCLVMSYRERHGELRLEVDREADALTLNDGANAYWIARQRAEEASSATMASAWHRVARAIDRRAARRPSLLATVFH